jgi:hypothetical protein
LPATKWALIPEFVEAIVSGRSGAEIALHEFQIMDACFAADAALAAGTTQEITYL